MEDLKNENIFACATINPSRRNLPNLKSDKCMVRGDHDYYVSNTGISLVKWKDKRSVHLISNYHNPMETATVKRRNKCGEKEDIPCPLVLVDYNQNMNCVDKLDQLKSTYELDRKSHKWRHRIFFHCIDVCVVNSFIIYNMTAQKRMSLKDFKRECSHELLIPTLTTVKRRTTTTPVGIKHHKPFVAPNFRKTNASHMPVNTSRRRCALCSTKAVQVRTEWMCTTCKVPLCLNSKKNCFAEYHK